MEVKRVLYCDENKMDIDEVVIEDVKSVHLERLDKGVFFLAINPKDKDDVRYVITFNTPRNGTIKCSGDYEV